MMMSEDLSAIFVKVHPQFRRKGIATKMYDAAEKKFSKPMVPSENLSEDAKHFWKNRWSDL